MKKSFVLLLVALLLCCWGCAEQEPEAFSGGTYIYEKEGFGGSFTLTLRADGTYSYYEGLLSSYMGIGTWTCQGDVLTLQEDPINLTFRFRVREEGLVFLAEQSDRFIYMDVADGDRFLRLTDYPEES